mmetsp:Transcript_19045/g.34346  ORF Transcript_19045/g.34346 Transcript_19045/m.34346 type:complete len:308 (+) Transcript_19045:1256-2179(+)
MLRIQMRCLSAGDEELASIRARASIGHREQTPLGMLDFEVFVRKFLAVNTLSTSSIGIGEISTLNHEVFNNAVENRSLVMQWLSRNSIPHLTSTQGSEVIGSFRCNVSIKLHDDPAKVLVALLHIEEYMRIVSLSIGYQRCFFVIIHADLPEDSSKLRLLFLLCLCIFYLQLLYGLAHVFVLVVKFVSSHEIFLGLPQISSLHLRQSQSVKYFNIGLGLIGNPVENLIAAMNDIRPILSFNITHGCVSPAFHIHISLIVRKRFATLVLVYEVCRLLVQISCNRMVSSHELFRALFFHLGCLFHAFLR